MATKEAPWRTPEQTLETMRPKCFYITGRGLNRARSRYLLRNRKKRKKRTRSEENNKNRSTARNKTLYSKISYPELAQRSAQRQKDVHPAPQEGIRTYQDTMEAQSRNPPGIKTPEYAHYIRCQEPLFSVLSIKSPPRKYSPQDEELDMPE